ncbi:hypothetical protein M405DRAFT_838473 [Rhizopogon salebrosus TDB-379]|nr:hypothetical protein M405DRAFT_838473 [Rhizopogon salebrosus TDB-379]
MPLENPFGDRQAVPGYQLYPPQQPAALMSPVVPGSLAFVFATLSPTEPVAVLLPAMHEVILTNPVRQVLEWRGEYRILRKDATRDEHTSHSATYSERHPLINRQNRLSTPPITTTFPEPSPSSQAEPYHYISQPTPQRAQAARLEGNSSPHTYSYGSVSRPYAACGWMEHALPHGMKYFANLRIQATTDADLQNSAKLTAVMSVVERTGSVPERCEMWVRDGPAMKMDWRRQKKAGGLVISWVDHQTRRVSREIPSFDGVIHSGEDDRLDDEYRWSFVESHPAHVSLPTDARNEAIDALHWSYTDPLWAYHQPVTLPFSQDECHKLLTHLNDPSLTSTTRIWMIARILLRVASQTNIPVGRMFVDTLVGILCLGIPFLFVDGSTYGGHLGLESGMASSTGSSMFLVQPWKRWTQNGLGWTASFGTFSGTCCCVLPAEFLASQHQVANCGVMRGFNPVPIS